ncbi:TA system VapC family ribonuclease toxin [Paramicrobacterium fandaimingii]|uniref:TA system VapC family ribonuclease toxin n=1 Tax=Paramicrobacterium fandaimingii TaxID=2708079 RepID=UPI00141F6DF0|nr:TA system VapC family ribonuclease toxin [Microbacterium fandaimingii]
MKLLDVGVWLAAAWGRHIAHPTVQSWFDQQDSELVFCRVTEMGFLRLLSNPSIMREDTLTRADSWSVLDRLRADERVIHLEEPTNLESVWRTLSARGDTSHKLWTDDYLAAFAQARGLSVVTLDRAFAGRHQSLEVELLS